MCNVAWQLMTPQVGGPISEQFFSRYDASVQAALNSGPNVHVILDLVSCLLVAEVAVIS